MIRPNPTAIPLRASDVKLLQAEMEKRRAMHTGEKITDETSPLGAGGDKGESGASEKGREQGGYDAVHAAAERRQGLSAAERIG